MTDTSSTLNEQSNRAKLLDLSLNQIIGGSMAAATAAALGSRLGVVGTIAGAAVGSVVTAVAANLYTNSMARARDAIAASRALTRAAGLPQPLSQRTLRWRVPERVAPRRVLVTAAVVFAVAAAFLTGLQLATGADVTGTSIGTRSGAGAPADPGTGGAGGTPIQTRSGTPTPAKTRSDASQAPRETAAPNATPDASPTAPTATTTVPVNPTGATPVTTPGQTSPTTPKP